MKVFDFDNTIYSGESTVDFFLFCIKKKPSLIKYLPLVLKMVFLYKMRKLPLEKLYSIAIKMMNVVVDNKENADSFIEEFWSINKKKLREEFLDMIEQDDVVISGSPILLLDGVKEYLNTDKIYGTIIDLEGKEKPFICYGENKLLLLKLLYKDLHIDEVYTDSYSDLPLIMNSDVAYMVKNNKIKRIKS